jgi:hypothetical protein
VGGGAGAGGGVAARREGGRRERIVGVCARRRTWHGGLLQELPIMWGIDLFRATSFMG